MCTEKQKRCIYAISKELGQKIDPEKIAEMSTKDASKYIGRLNSLKEDKFKVPEQLDNKKFNELRFGMCVKLVISDKASVDRAIAMPESFTKKVSALYQLVAEVEETIKNDVKNEGEFKPASKIHTENKIQAGGSK